MHRIALYLFVTGLFTICSGGPVVYDTSSTGFSSAFTDLASDGKTSNLTRLDETVANSEHESEGTTALGDAVSISPGGTPLSRAEGMEVLSAFMLGDSTDIADAPTDADVATGNIFAYMPAIPVTIAILMVGTGLILVGRLKRRRGSRRRS